MEQPEPENHAERDALRRRGRRRLLFVTLIAYGLLGLMCVIAGILIAIRLSS
jgi:hypothetical protein